MYISPMPTSGKALEENSRFCKHLYSTSISSYLYPIVSVLFSLSSILKINFLLFQCIHNNAHQPCTPLIHAVFIIGCFGLPWLWVVNCMYLHDKLDNPNNGDIRIWYQYSLIGSIILFSLLVMRYLVFIDFSFVLYMYIDSKTLSLFCVRVCSCYVLLRCSLYGLCCFKRIGGNGG